MFCRAAMLWGALLVGTVLVGCQNGSQQLSIYAPFGPAVVPTPALTRANSTPYYTPPADPKSAVPGGSPETAATSDSNKLSHYDPYRGLLVPGNFSPSPVALRSEESWGSRDAALASAPRERASNEEPIRIVEGNSSAFVAQGSGRTAALPSGVVRPTLSLPPPPAVGGSATEIATRPRAAAPSLAPVRTPASNLTPPAGAPILNPPPMNPPATAPAASNPAEPRRLSLWDNPRNGSRVMPASHLEEAPALQAAGSWRAR
jgi:hypothetical protein